MDIYVLRHGAAEPRDAGIPDAKRKLTAKGRKDLQAVVEAARRGKIAPQLMLTSPLVRAEETAKVAAGVFKDCPVVTTKKLLPSADPGSIWKEACANPAISRVMLVGHEPHLSHLIAFLLEAPLNVDLKKGGLVRIATPGRADSPRGVLKWMITPRLARSL